MRASSGPPTSWACRSLALLRSWGVADYADGFFSETYASYRRYVVRRLFEIARERDLPSRCKHVIPVPHHVLCPTARCPWKDMLRQPLPWPCLVGSRSWARVRLGLLSLSHKGGRRSRARRQRCIFCDAWVSNSYQHVLADCANWVSYRNQCCAVLGSTPGRAVDLVRSLLTKGPGDACFVPMVAWCSEIDRSHTCFWKSRGIRIC